MMSVLKRHVCIIFMFLVAVTRVDSQTTSASAATPACCALKLMDASQQVAIETDRVLAAGTYRAARIRVCATDTVLIQLWTRLSSSTLQLKWQTSFTPTVSQTYQTSVTAVFDNSNRPTVASSDRLGLYGVVSLSSDLKMDIPYELDDTNGAVHFSTSRYNDSSLLIPGLQVTVGDESFSRTFASYVKFCVQADCSDIGADRPPTTTTPNWYISSTPKPFCGCPTSCSPDVMLSDSINTQQSNIEVLEDQIEKMTDLIDSLSSSNVQTGYCPDNTLPGVYGIGSCYIIYREYVQLGEAAIRCAVNHGANLLDIESDVEQRFIHNILTNNGSTNTGIETYWTAGMYDMDGEMWMWYRQDMTPRAAIAANSYRGWRNNQEPKPTSEIDTCLVLKIDTIKEESYWDKNICFSQNYFICEIPKMCY
jgi:hypothetical protein